MIYQVRSILGMVMDLIMAAIAFFLGMRVILELFNANPLTPFVSWVYGLSGGLMYPFHNLIPNLELPGLGFLDITALVTLLAYSLIGYLVLAAIRAAMPVGDYYEHRRVV